MEYEDWMDRYSAALGTDVQKASRNLPAEKPPTVNWRFGSGNVKPPTGARPMGPGLLALIPAAYEGFKQLGRATGISQAAEAWGNRLAEDYVPMKMDDMGNILGPKYQFTGLPEKTKAEIAAGKRAKPLKMYTGQEVSDEVDRAIEAYRASQKPVVGGGGGNKEPGFMDRLGTLMDLLGLHPKGEMGKDYAEIIKGSDVSYQPYGKPVPLAGRIGAPEATKLFSNLMTASAHEIPESGKASAMLRGVALEELFAPKRQEIQEEQLKILQEERKKNKPAADTSPGVGTIIANESGPQPFQFKDFTTRGGAFMLPGETVDLLAGETADETYRRRRKLLGR